MAQVSITPDLLTSDSQIELTDNLQEKLAEFQKKYPWVTKCSLFKYCRKDGSLLKTRRAATHIRVFVNETQLLLEEGPLNAIESSAEEAFQRVILADGNLAAGWTVGSLAADWVVVFLRDLLSLLGKGSSITGMFTVESDGGVASQQTWTASLTLKGKLICEWEAEDLSDDIEDYDDDDSSDSNDSKRSADNRMPTVDEILRGL